MELNEPVQACAETAGVLHPPVTKRTTHEYQIHSLQRLAHLINYEYEQVITHILNSKYLFTKAISSLIIFSILRAKDSTHLTVMYAPSPASPHTNI